MQANSSLVHLPPVGTIGYRQLDELLFRCEVIRHESHQQMKTFTVRFLDDQQIEEGLSPEEFIFPTEIEGDKSNRSSIFHLYTTINFQKESLLTSVFAFLDHLEWITTLILVGKPWLHEICKWQHWQVLRLPPVIPIRRSRKEERLIQWHHSTNWLLKIFECVLDTNLDRLRSCCCWDDNNHVGDIEHPTECSAEEEQTKLIGKLVRVLVLDGTSLSNKQVLHVIRRCTNIRHLSLRQCDNLSFLLLYDLLQLVKAKETLTGDYDSVTTYDGNTRTTLADLESVDMWLCKGISPTFVNQMQHHSRQKRLKITGPGFYIAEVSEPTEQWVTREVNTNLMQERSRSTGHVKGALFSIHFVSKEAVCDRQHHQNPIRQVLNHLIPHSETFPLTAIPFVNLTKLYQHAKNEPDQVSCGFVWAVPATIDDLFKLVNEFEAPEMKVHVHQMVTSFAEDTFTHATATKHEQEPPGNIDPLAARAARVFARLHEVAHALETQVARLETQVQQMQLAKDQAQNEYYTAQLALKQAANDADRALLSLATGGTAVVNHPPPPAPSRILSNNAKTVQVIDGDELLPNLPSIDTFQRLGSNLADNNFVVLDGFVGSILANQVHQEVECLYRSSRTIAITDEVLSSPSTAGKMEGQIHFRRGELAGGNTGQNLRYQMHHVRGDSVLWLDEHDTFCPEGIKQVLRQLDRLVIDRLVHHNHELAMSTLMRKKAMLTCYPGNGARYTKHCDNPNQNGRKLTAILYLNPDWESQHGGELLLHQPLSGSRAMEQRTIAPLLDRLLLFFSDRRVPHEVLPCCGDQNRFALTVWYLDYDEFMMAQVFGTVMQDPKTEAARIQEEMHKFAQQNGLIESST